MPIYEYTCKDCRCSISEIKPISKFARSCKCPCGGRAKLAVSLPGMPDFGFKPFTTEHITGEAVYVENRSHKNKLLRKHDLTEV